MEIKQDVLFRALVKMIAALKAERTENLRLSNDVAALRSALQEIHGGDFLPLVEQYRGDLEETINSAMAASVASLDETLP